MTEFYAWDHKAEQGREAELWVEDIRASFLSDAVETKRDLQAAKYPNIFIEFMSCNRTPVHRLGRYWPAGWQPSGIWITKSTTWFHTLRLNEFGLTLSTIQVKKIAAFWMWRRHRQGRPEYKEMSPNRTDNPTRGVLVPKEWLMGAYLRDGCPPTPHLAIEASDPSHIRLRFAEGDEEAA